MDTALWSATKLIRALKAKKVGALELLDLYAARIAKYDKALNALPVLDMDVARKRARAYDRKGAKVGALAGLPMTMKESFDLKGHPTTWGLAEYCNTPVQSNGLAVQRFLDAGGNVFGKSNVPTLLADWETLNPVYGKTVNPWNHERTPGGSSGGAAVALAAGLTGLEAGSDIGGSIRNPAHYCGVYGHKSTYGVCSMQGHTLPGVAHPADISVIGPLARSAEDLELALNIMAGPMRSTAQAGSSRCRSPHARRCAAGVSRSSRPIPRQRQTQRCRTRSAASRSSSRARAPRCPSVRCPTSTWARRIACSSSCCAGDFGPADARVFRADGGRKGEARPEGHGLLRADGSRQCAAPQGTGSPLPTAATRCA